MNTIGGNGVFGLTASAGTAIKFLIPPRVGGVTRVSKITYTPGATPHTITFARAIGRARTTAAAALGATSITVNTDPNLAILAGNAIAANDWIAIRELDNVTRLYQVSGVAGLVLTISALTAGCGINADVWAFGVLGDTDPRTGVAHPNVSISSATTYEDREGGVVAGHAQDEPIWVNVNNLTNAGVLTQLNWAYTVG